MVGVAQKSVLGKKKKVGGCRSINGKEIWIEGGEGTEREKARALSPGRKGRKKGDRINASLILLSLSLSLLFIYSIYKSLLTSLSSSTGHCTRIPTKGKILFYFLKLSNKSKQGVPRSCLYFDLLPSWLSLPRSTCFALHPILLTLAGRNQYFNIERSRYRFNYYNIKIRKIKGYM
jgi:hypothetical protein